jgi:hypothetical protein
MPRKIHGDHTTQKHLKTPLLAATAAKRACLTGCAQLAVITQDVR